VPLIFKPKITIFRKFLENPKKVADRENFCKKKKPQKRLE